MAEKRDTIRLLLVDDESEFRDAAGKALRRQGFQVGEAGSGEHALELIPREKPDLVILDLKMGGIDGIETLSRIRRIDPDLPVMILTGHGRYEHALAGIQLGVVDFVQKPVDMETLGDRIRELVRGGKRTLRERSLEELMVPQALYPRIYVDETVQVAARRLREVQEKGLAEGETDRGRRTLLVFDRTDAFKGIIRAEDLLRLTIPTFLLESPYSSYLTGMFLAQAKVVGRLPLMEVLMTPPTLDVGAPLMEAAAWLVSRHLSHLPILKEGALVGILRPEDLCGEIEALSKPAGGMGSP